MQKRQGISLIEVLVSMVLLTILLVASVTIMTNLFVIMSRGKAITSDSFDGQMVMENALLTAKSSFVANSANRTLFSGTAYQSTIPVRHVQTAIAGSRFFNTYISSTPIVTPPSPSITDFKLDVVNTGTTTPAFPWIEDNIQLRAYYTLAASPQVYETRTRWYRSPITLKPASTLIWNPIFSSQFSIDREIIRNSTFLTDVQLVNKADLLVNNFYHFEIMPYTLPGKIAQRLSDNRIAILNKTSSTLYNNFMQSAYFDTALELNTSSYSTHYIDTMNNAERPTLHVDSDRNTSAPGSITAIPLTGFSAYNQVQVNAKMQFDPLTLDASTGKMSAGLMIGDVTSARDTGHMLDFDVENNEISLKYVQNGAYQAGYSTVTQSTSALNNGSFSFAWDKEYTYALTMSNVTKTLTLRLTDTSGNLSNVLSFNTASLFTFRYLGLKAYSTLDYNPISEYELLGRYARKYTVHIYLIEATGANVVPPDTVYGGDYFVRTGNLSIGGDTQIISGNSALLIQNPGGTQNLTGNNLYQAKDIIIDSNLNFTSSSRLEAQDNIYIKGNVTVDNGGAALKSKVIFIRGNVNLTNSGNLQATEDLIIDGNLTFSNAGAYLQAKRIYVSGNVTFNSGAKIYSSEKTAIKGQLAFASWSAQIQSPRTELERAYTTTSPAAPHFTISPVLQAYTIPAIGFVTVAPVPLPQTANWYTRDQAYFNNFDVGSPNYQTRIPALANNRKIVTQGNYVFPQSGDNQNVDYSNLVIVSLTGNINITLNNKRFVGLLYAPNGSITLNGIDSGLADNGLRGYFISKNSMTVSPNNVSVIQVPLVDILGSSPVPFIE